MGCARSTRTQPSSGCKVLRDPASREFVWLHFSLGNSSTEKWLQDHLPIPEHYFETLREATGLDAHRAGRRLPDCGHQRRDLFDFSYEPSQIATLWMCVHRNFVVSARLHPLRSIDRLRVSVKAGEPFASPVSLLTHLLRDQADVLQQIARDCDDTG